MTRFLSVVKKSLAMDKLVNTKCRSASFALHKIGQIRQLINKTTAEKLIHASVITQNSYWHRTLHGYE